MTNQEIIDGLRDLAQNQKSLDCGDHDIFEYDHDVCMAAASAIERLEAENAELKRYRQIAEVQDKRIDEMEAENAALRQQLAEKSKLILQLAQEMERRDKVIKYQEKEIGHITAERDALRAQQEQPNEPLTLAELREMDGESVWCVDSDGTVPGLVCMYEGLADVKKEPHIWIPDNEEFVKMYSIRHMLDSGAKFYRRRPEQDG